jgi:UDP-glucose 4-epimerase
VRILITGVAGFIGSTVADALLAEGHEIGGVDNFTTGQRQNLDPRIHFQELDISEGFGPVFYRDFPSADLVIHCAASYKNPDAWWDDTLTNVVGGVAVADWAREKNVPIIYFQTILPPVSSYAISKIAGEQYLRLSGVPLTVFRLANIYGPRNLSGPVPVFYKRITNGQPCMVVDTTRDMVFIDDLVRAVKMAIKYGWTGTFDVFSGQQTPIMDLFKTVAFFLDHSEEPPVIPPDPDDVQGTLSADRLPPLWAPEVSLMDGIRKTVASYDAAGINDTYTHLRMKG